MTPREHLTQRGIAAQADLAGWQEGDGRWPYPVFHYETGEVIAYRGKAYPSNSGKFKYSWLPEKPSDPASDWYILLGTANAIAAANGVAWLANGEPSLLAYRAAGINNAVATTLSEISVPRNLKQVLNALGITRLLYPHDNDDAGHKSAIKWRDALRGTGIDYEAFTWGKNAPNKADANDIWIALAFDAAAFQTKLKSLESVVLPEPIVMPKVELGSFDETPRGLIDAVAASLGIQRFRANGWSVKNVSSPFREDKEPSAGFNQLSGVLHDFGTEESYSIKEVAERLGIDWKPYYPKGYIVKKSNDTKVAKPKKAALIPMAVGIESSTDEDLAELPLLPGYSFSWIDQKNIPASWFSSLLNLSDGRSSVPLVVMKLHEAFRTGKLNAAKFTIKEAVEATGVPRKSLSAAIETLIEWTFVSILETIINTMYTPLASEQKSNPNSSPMGRPSQYYCINRDSKFLSLLLAEMMDYCVTEAFGRKTLVPPTHTMIEDLTAQGLEITEAKLWSSQTEGIGKYTKLRLEAELALWNKALLQDGWNKSYDLPIEDIESSRDLRVHLLRAFLSEQAGGGVQISNERLAWMLGCDSSNLKAIYKDAIVFSERRFTEYEPEFEAIQNSDYDKLMRDAGQEGGGLPIGMLIKKISDNRWMGYFFKEAVMFDVFKREHGNIARMKIRVEQPSFVRLGRLKSGYFSRVMATWLLLAVSLKLLVDLEVELEATQAEISEDQKEDVNELAAVLPKPEKKPRFRTTVERSWRSHDHEFLHEQVRIYAHVFTQDGLLPENLVLAEAVRYVNKHAQKHPVRTIASYFEEDDSLSTLLGTLELLGGEKRNGLHPKPRKDEMEVLPQVASQEDEYAEYLNNPYLHPMEKARREEDVKRWKANKLASAA